MGVTNFFSNLQTEMKMSAVMFSFFQRFLHLLHLQQIGNLRTQGVYPFNSGYDYRSLSTRGRTEHKDTELAVLGCELVHVR